MKKATKIIVRTIREHPGAVFLSIFLLLIIIGATIFHYIEGWSWFDSFYYAFIVMSTVGFGDFVPVTTIGKIITIFYGFIGIPMFIVGSGIFIQKIFYTHFKKYIAKMNREIEEEMVKQEEGEKQQENQGSRLQKIFRKN